MGLCVDWPLDEKHNAPSQGASGCAMLLNLMTAATSYVTYYPSGMCFDASRKFCVRASMYIAVQ